jgi:hypothetical protein
VLPVSTDTASYGTPGDFNDLPYCDEIGDHPSSATTTTTTTGGSTPGAGDENLGDSVGQSSSAIRMAGDFTIHSTFTATIIMMMMIMMIFA